MSSGAFRRIDDLGRIVIPKSTRQALGIQEGDLMETSIQGNAVVVRKVRTQCAICEGMEGVMQIGWNTETGEVLRVRDGLPLCRKCLAQLGGRFNEEPEEDDGENERFEPEKS